MERNKVKFLKKTEIYILAGFLGSGKTTFLQKLLQFEKDLGRNVGVVMNEVGQVSIDSRVVADDLPLKELLEGCVCCTIQDQFEEQLQQMIDENSLDAIYIETTGVAHPLEVYDACISPAFAHKIEIRGIISVLDLSLWKNIDQLNSTVTNLIIEQIRHADVLILNKSDLVTEGDQASLLFSIQSFNSQAQTILTSYVDIEPSLIINMKLNEKAEKVQVHLRKHLKIDSFVYHFHHSINRKKFESFLTSLPDTIYRIKGFLRFSDMDMLYSFQYSNHVPILLPDLSNSPTNLVFIGEQINKQALGETLHSIEQV